MLSDGMCRNAGSDGGNGGKLRAGGKRGSGEPGAIRRGK